MIFLFFYFWNLSYGEDSDSSQCLDLQYPKQVWSYWEEKDTLPEDIVEMINITKKSLGNFKYIFLVANNVSLFLNVSLFPRYFPRLQANHKSEYIRVSLIEKYGGMYIDCSTYITSGSEMEWFYSEGVKSKKEMWGFGFGDGRVNTNFFGGSTQSTLLKAYKQSLDEIATDNFDAYCLEHITEETDNGRWCFDILYSKFVLENPSFENTVLMLPRTKSHYRLQEECQHNFNCVKDRLQNDPTVRSYPFIKVERKGRLGHKINFSEPLHKNYFPKSYPPNTN